MEEDKVVGKRGVYVDARMMTILWTWVYFNFSVFRKFVDVSESFSWQGRGPSGDRIGTSVFVPRKFIGGVVGGNLEGARRTVRIRSTRRGS